MERKERGKRDRQKGNLGEDALKLTPLHGKHQGMDAAPQPTMRLLPWRLTQSNNGEMVAVVYVWSIHLSMQNVF